MAHVVFLMLPEAGHLLPTFKIARDLACRGHRITYLTTSNLLTLPLSRGFDALPILQDEHLNLFRSGTKRLSKFRHSRRRATKMHATHSTSIERQIEQINPDIVLVDRIHVDTHADMLSRRRIPILLVTTSLPDEREAQLPPVTAHTIPTRSLASRISIELSWARVFVERWCSYLLKDPSIARPRLYYGRPEIVLCSEEFDFLRPGRDTRHYVGPSVDLDRPQQHFPWNAIDAKAKLIYCSFGTQAHRYPNRETLLRRITEAVGRCRNEQLVITSDRQTIMRMGKLPSNVLAVESAPQIDLLRRASIAVSHGGLGSLKECVLLGVPMIVFPQAFDQAGNAARVAHHQIGFRYVKQPSTSHVRELLDGIDATPSIRDNLRRMQRTFQRDQADDFGARVIENHIVRNPRSGNRSIIRTCSKQAHRFGFPAR